MQPFDGTGLTYTTKDVLNAIAANMDMTAGPEQSDSLYHEAWILKKDNRHDTNSSNRLWTKVVFTFTSRNNKELANFWPRISKDF